MKIAALEEFLSNSDLAGSQSFQILEKFLLYAKLVQDPFNVFRYMEEKAICTYFPLFWYSKSEYLAELGDYRNAFLCLQEAEKRISIEDNDDSTKIINTQLKAKMYRNQIDIQMRRYPPNRRRTFCDFLITSSRFEQLDGDDQQKYQALFILLETKCINLRSNKQRDFYRKNEDKPKSWLYEIYKKEQQKVLEIILDTVKMHTSQQKEKQASIQSIVKDNVKIENQQRLFKSVNTPFKRRDPMRMAKTLDSVEMMKRKRKSDDKMTKNFFVRDSDQLSQNLEEDQNELTENDPGLSMNTVPVGQEFEKKKKQVKFLDQQRFSTKIQKPRCFNHLNQSVDEIIETKKIADGPKKGILKNNSIEKTEFKKSDIRFPQIIAERHLEIKKTEERDI